MGGTQQMRHVAESGKSQIFKNLIRNMQISVFANNGIGFDFFEVGRGGKEHIYFFLRKAFKLTTFS